MGLSVLALALACTEPKPAEPAAAERREPAPAVIDRLEQARRAAQCVDAQQIASAVEMHLLMEPGSCPADVGALVSAKVLARVPDGAPSWSIACDDAEVIVRAPGDDGRLGTDDDLVHGGPQANCKPD